VVQIHSPRPFFSSGYDDCGAQSRASGFRDLRTLALSGADVNNALRGIPSTNGLCFLRHPHGEFVAPTLEEPTIRKHQLKSEIPEQNFFRARIPDMTTSFHPRDRA
jgi:hypothetical protein